MPGHLAWVLLRPAWVRLDRLRTGAGRLQSSMNKWRLAPTSIFECGELDQAAGYVILKCALHRAPRGYHGMAILHKKT